MGNKYDEWIAAYAVQQKNQLLGKCRQAVHAMLETFPELQTVRGHVETPWGPRGHWWLVTADGDIVDPTAAQFPAIYAYEVWKPGDKVRTGRCMYCGDDIWRGVDSLDVMYRDEFCDGHCSDAYAASLMMGLL